ncbi:MAG: hypothetical protein ACYCW6_19265 [Candidatus Xenobia bacterium]
MSDLSIGANRQPSAGVPAPRQQPAPDYDLIDTCNVVLSDPKTDLPTAKQVLALRAGLLQEAGLPDTSQQHAPWAARWYPQTGR